MIYFLLIGDGQMTQNEANQTNTIVIGASTAGLAAAACLQQQNVPFILLEASHQVGNA